MMRSLLQGGVMNEIVGPTHARDTLDGPASVFQADIGRPCIRHEFDIAQIQ